MRGGQFLIYSLNLFHLHNQNDTVTGAQEWEWSRASFLLARLARTSHNSFTCKEDKQVAFHCESVIARAVASRIQCNPPLAPH